MGKKFSTHVDERLYFIVGFVAAMFIMYGAISWNHFSLPPTYQEEMPEESRYLVSVFVSNYTNPTNFRFTDMIVFFGERIDQAPIWYDFSAGENTTLFSADGLLAVSHILINDEVLNNLCVWLVFDRTELKNMSGPLRNIDELPFYNYHGEEFDLVQVHSFLNGLVVRLLITKVILNGE